MNDFVNLHKQLSVAVPVREAEGGNRTAGAWPKMDRRVSV